MIGMGTIGTFVKSSKKKEKKKRIRIRINYRARCNDSCGVRGVLGCAQGGADHLEPQAQCVVGGEQFGGGGVRGLGVHLYQRLRLLDRACPLRLGLCRLLAVGDEKVADRVLPQESTRCTFAPAKCVGAEGVTVRGDEADGSERRKHSGRPDLQRLLAVRVEPGELQSVRRAVLKHDGVPGCAVPAEWRPVASGCLAEGALAPLDANGGDLVLHKQLALCGGRGEATRGRLQRACAPDDTLCRVERQATGGREQCVLLLCACLIHAQQPSGPRRLVGHEELFRRAARLRRAENRGERAGVGGGRRAAAVGGAGVELQRGDAGRRRK
mmetsp:Transcript_40957/g.96408  ORF Transcript_40957/g.96408 Transcript_40957/m.96408 type:complete len:326 (-) Transcript_40957:76-1053(-)